MAKIPQRSIITLGYSEIENYVLKGGPREQRYLSICSKALSKVLLVVGIKGAKSICLRKTLFQEEANSFIEKCLVDNRL